MKTIGIFTSIYGHESIAEAIAEKIKQKAKNKYSVKTFFIKRNHLDLTYDYFYKIHPAALGSPFHWSSKITQKDKNVRKLADVYFTMSYNKEITSFIKKKQN